MTLILPRPASLAEVAERSDDTTSFDAEMVDFLHEFKFRPRLEAITEEPELLASRFPLGDVADAYLAAVAGMLAERLQTELPSWTRKPERFRREPWFASPGRHMRALLLAESPWAFRERNLFVSADAITVY
jgi:hypothetical protein